MACRCFHSTFPAITFWVSSTTMKHFLTCLTVCLCLQKEEEEEEAEIFARRKNHEDSENCLWQLQMYGNSGGDASQPLQRIAQKWQNASPRSKDMDAHENLSVYTWLITKQRPAELFQGMLVRWWAKRMGRTKHVTFAKREDGNISQTISSASIHD